MLFKCYEFLWILYANSSLQSSPILHIHFDWTKVCDLLKIYFVANT